MLHTRTLAFFMVVLFTCTSCAIDSAPKLPMERPYILGGKEDSGNLYPNTLMLSARLNQMEAGDCSGVLISPHRVLTAAHCVCLEKPVTSPLRDARTVIDGSICLKTVSVTAAIYGSATPEKHYTGIKVEPHPGLRLLYDKDGNLVSAESDLAVIHLKNAIQGIRSVELSKKPMEPGSAVALVGFGNTGLTSEPDARKRYFGRTEISQVEGEILRVTKPGAQAYVGDSGGPCFRWEQGKARPALVGIIRGGGAPVYSTITSTAFPKNREWIEKIQREDTQADAESP
jgi:hypothetical protein